MRSPRRRRRPSGLRCGLVKAARARGEHPTGPDGLLKSITKEVRESALEEEMSEHVGYDKHAPVGRNGANSRNGTRVKTVMTDTAGKVEVAVPRDRDGTFSRNGGARSRSAAIRSAEQPCSRDAHPGI